MRVFPAIFLEISVGDYLAPYRVTLVSLHIASRKGIPQWRGQHNDNKVLIGIVVLEIEAFQVAVVPVFVIPLCDWVVLVEPVIVGPQCQLSCASEQKQQADEHYNVE